MGYFKPWHEKNMADIDPQKESREIWELATEIKEDFKGRHPDAIYKYCAEIELQKTKLKDDTLNNHDKLKKLKFIIEYDINSIHGESISEIAKIQTYNSVLTKVTKLIQEQ